VSFPSKVVDDLVSVVRENPEADERANARERVETENLRIRKPSKSFARLISAFSRAEGRVCPAQSSFEVDRIEQGQSGGSDFVKGAEKLFECEFRLESLRTRRGVG